MNIRTSTLLSINLCPNFNLIRRRVDPLLASSEMPLEECHVEDCSGRHDRARDRRHFACLRAAGSGRARLAPRWRPSVEDISAFGDARIAALHAGLKLTAEQEKNWPAVESALRDIAKQRSERFAARASADRPKDPIERLSLRADVMAQRGAALKKLADAAGPLYKSLDDGQKHRFVVLARLDAQRSAAARHRGQRGCGMHRGQRSPERGPMGAAGGPQQQ